MKIGRWLLLVAVLALWGCSDDDTVGTSTRHLRFVNLRNQSPYVEYWILLSNPTGKVLDAKKLVDDETYDYAFPNDTALHTVTMIIVENSVSSGRILDSKITAYLSVPPGDYGYRKYPEYVENPERISAVSVRGFDMEERPLESFCMTPTNSKVHPDRQGLDITVPMKTEKTGLLVLSRNTTPREYLYLEMEPDKTFERTKADFKPCEMKTIGSPIEAGHQAWVNGVDPLGNYLPYHASSAERGVPLVVAAMPEVFSKYLLSVDMHVENNVYSHNQLSKELPDEMTIINGSLENLTLLSDGVSWNATGTVDQVMLRALTWEVRGPAHQPRVVLPTIPQTIPLKGPDGRSFYTASRQANPLTSRILDRSYANGYIDCLPYHDRPTFITELPGEWLELWLTSPVSQ